MHITAPHTQETLVTWSGPARLQVPVNNKQNVSSPTKTLQREHASDSWAVNRPTDYYDARTELTDSDNTQLSCDFQPRTLTVPVPGVEG